MKLIPSQPSSTPPCDLGCTNRAHCASESDTCSYFIGWVATGWLDTTMNSTPKRKRPKNKYRDRPIASPQEFKRQLKVKNLIRGMDTPQLTALGALVNMKVKSLRDLRAPSHALSKRFMAKMGSTQVMEFIQQQGIGHEVAV